jgi:hypothetical protein
MNGGDVRPGRRPHRILRRGFAIGLGAALMVVLIIHHATLPIDHARKAYWKPQGLPCQAISRPALLAKGLGLDQEFEFQDIRLTRVAGGVFCSGESGRTGLFRMVITGPTVCQMTNPIAFSVVAGGREYNFAPGRQAATVMVSKGALSCVLASNFKYGD